MKYMVYVLMGLAGANAAMASCRDNLSVQPMDKLKFLATQFEVDKTSHVALRDQMEVWLGQMKVLGLSMMDAHILRLMLLAKIKEWEWRANTPRWQQCFLAGTRVDTPSGPVEIEKLAVGDLVYSFDESPHPSW